MGEGRICKSILSRDLKSLHHSWSAGVHKEQGSLVVWFSDASACMIDSDIGLVALQAVKSVQRNGATEATDRRTHRRRVHVLKRDGGLKPARRHWYIEGLPGVLGMD